MPSGRSDIDQGNLARSPRKPAARRSGAKPETKDPGRAGSEIDDVETVRLAALAAGPAQLQIGEIK